MLGEAAAYFKNNDAAEIADALQRATQESAQQCAIGRARALQEFSPAATSERLAALAK